MDEQKNETMPEMPMNDACECDCGQCADAECACEDGVCTCEECMDYPEFYSEEGPYHIRIKLGEDEFEFESPDRESFEDIGLGLLKKTFGRYADGKNEGNE